MAAVELKKVHKHYPGVHVVKGVDLKIDNGEFIVLLGPSGCGKSTTLRMIAGLEDISDGDVCIGSRIVNDLEPKERDIAMVFQSYALYPHLNVYNNIAFGLRLAGTDKSIIDSKVHEVAEMLELTPLLKRKPAALSGGQRQRVAMGRAMVRTPKVFLFDEPLSNLDAKLRHSMRTEIRDMHNKMQKTTVYVTHDQVEAMTLADRIVVMNDGKIEQIGTPKEVFLRPANRFVASFIGTPTMNFIDVELTHEKGCHVLLNQQGLRLPGALFGGHDRAVLGIRPSDLTLTTSPSDKNSHFELPGELINYELLGSTALCAVSIGSCTLQVEVSATVPLNVGMQCWITPDISQIHLFDHASGQSIYEPIG